tara:strand:+ start:14109 stop:15836 length:1728 start_codon:yes stop_codon:yes gene_type:complete
VESPLSVLALKKQAEKVSNDMARLNGHRRKSTKLELLPWVRKFITLRQESFDLDGHEYLADIYTDPTPFEVYRKAAQVGISTKCLLEAIWLCDKYHGKVLYYMATDTDADDFSNDRINTVIDDCNYLTQLAQERERGRDNVRLRHIAKGSLYCRGMFTKGKVKSVDADMIILDELDEADQENKRFAYDRILHSKLQMVRELSQPSIPDYGIDETYQKTDQRYWNLKCSACNKWTCLDHDHIREHGRVLPRHILEIPKTMASQFQAEQKYYRACAHCQAALDMSKGEWIALHPDRVEKRGYHISQLYRQQPIVGFPDPADWIMDQLLGARKTAEKMRLTISILGLPYAGDRAPVTEQTLDAAERDQGFHHEARGAYIGIDQGDELHISVGLDDQTDPDHTKIKCIHFEQTDDWTRIPQLVKQFGARCLVIDALPNKKTAKDVCNDLEIPAYIQYFKGDTMKAGTEGEDEKSVRKVQVDRTESIDETVGMLVQTGKLILPNLSMCDAEQTRTMEDVRSHLKMAVKDVVERANGVKVWEYKKNVTNHFLMATNSMRIARDLAPITGSVIMVGSDIMPG